MGGLVQQSATSRSLRRQATDRVRGPVRAGRPDQSGRLRLNQRVSTEPGAVQTAAAMLLEATLEPIFHRDNYGYRPGRSAHDALAVARRRCWRQDWVLDIDVRAFLDASSHCSFR